MSEVKENATYFLLKILNRQQFTQQEVLKSTPERDVNKFFKHRSNGSSIVQMYLQRHLY